MTTDEAVNRQAAHECLMRELVEALEAYVAAIHFAQDRQSLMAAIKAADDRARLVLARAKEQQQ